MSTLLKWNRIISCRSKIRHLGSTISVGGYPSPVNRVFSSFTNRLVQNVRQKNGHADYVLPCFQLSEQHVPHVMKDPTEFHDWLCQSISSARERILLASLYMGDNASGKNEEERLLLSALGQENHHLKDRKILLDANRAKRSLPILTNFNKYLFPTTSDSSMIPNIIQEVLGGVFHIKIYIIDDQLVLSGANLSQEYFTTRQDRYILFPNGGAGLVDFYADLFHVLCNYSQELSLHEIATTKDSNHSHEIFKRKLNFSRSKEEEQMRRSQLMNDLHSLFYQSISSNDMENEKKDRQRVIAYAIPTCQFPSHLLSPNLCTDNEVIKNLITGTMRLTKNDTTMKSIALRLSSAYLNPTNNFISLLQQFSQSKIESSSQGHIAPSSGNYVHLMTAAVKSHGFAPKHQNRKKSFKDFVPFIFMELIKDFSSKFISNVNILLYEREGWTFHSKGLWLTATINNDSIMDNQSEEISKCNDAVLNTVCDHSIILATMIGSSNYGARSELLDIESNCLLILNHDDISTDAKNSVRKLNSDLTNEWNNLNKYAKKINMSSVADDLVRPKDSLLLGLIAKRKVLKYIRRYC